MLQLFPNGGATDKVVTLFCIAVGTAIAWCGGRCANAGWTLTVVLTAIHGSLVGLPGWRLFRGFTLLSGPFSHSSASLTVDLLASVDVSVWTLSCDFVPHN